MDFFLDLRVLLYKPPDPETQILVVKFLFDGVINTTTQGGSYVV